MKRFELIDNVEQAWRFVSVQLMTISTAILGVWALMPSEFKTYVPDGVMKGLLMLALIGGLVGRLFKQKRREKTPPTQEIELPRAIAPIPKRPKPKKKPKGRGRG